MAYENNEKAMIDIFFLRLPVPVIYTLLLAGNVLSYLA